MVDHNITRLIARLMTDYYYVDEFSVKQLAYSFASVVYLVETKEQSLVLRFAPSFRPLRRNVRALTLLSGKNIAPELYHCDMAPDNPGLIFSFEEYLPGTCFPYREKEARDKITPIIAKHYKKIMSVELPESARPYFEELGYKKMIFKKYFRKFTTVFRRMGFDEKYIDFAKERLPEPTRLRLIHGNLGFGHTLFHEGKVRFFNFTQSYFAEPELDWGKFYFREGVSDEAIKEAAALLDLDFDKIVYYAYLWAMQKLSVTRKYDPKRRKAREERFLAQLELLHKKLLK